MVIQSQIQQKNKISTAKLNSHTMQNKTKLKNY